MAESKETGASLAASHPDIDLQDDTKEIEIDSKTPPREDDLESQIIPDESPKDSPKDKGDGHSLHPHNTTVSIKPPQSLLTETIFIGLLCMAQLMTQAALGMSIAPLHIIGDSFGITDPGQLSWFPAAYSLTVGTFILIAGRLGDLYGHKLMFIGGFAWFGLWSLLGGFAVYSNQRFFDVCRAFQGIGPAFVMPNAIAIIGMSYEPGPRKSMIFGVFGSMAPGGFVLGATFSSLFAELVWWPWGYWVGGMVCWLFATIGLVVIPRCPGFDRDSSINPWIQADAAGASTGVVGLVFVNFAWNQAPVVRWQDPYIYILLIVGIIVLGMFAYVEKHARFPLVPFNVMSKDVGMLLTCVALGWASFGIWLFYMFQFLENLRHVSPSLAGAMTSPCAISGLCAAILTGYMIERVPGSVIMIGALVAFCIGTILLATAPVEQTYWAQTFVSFVVMPWGM